MDPKKIVTKYINDVLTGRELVGKPALKRVQRHVEDLKNEMNNGFYFDEKSALRALRFFPFLRHAKGSKFAGKPFILEPWQMFDVWCVFGWKRKGGLRRFSVWYLFIAKKNGKTALAGGVGMYMLMMDNEPGAEVYSIATKYQQARICLDDTRNIVKKSPEIKSRAQVWQHSITCEAMGSTFKALASDSETQDGLNPHLVIIDEYHAHKDNLLVENMESAMVNREQPLMFYITTAGFNHSSPCFRFHEVALKVLDGTVIQDNMFISIHVMDDPDKEWEDPANWVKANPNIGASVNVERLVELYKDAKNNTDKLTGFLTKNMNIWTDSPSVWIEKEKWDACNRGVENLDGMECYGGLDLASVRDTTALVLRFKMPDGRSVYRAIFWLPEMSVTERVKKKGINYDVWIREGWLRITPGNITDYNFIKQDILALREKYKLKSIAYDRWNSSQLVIDLTELGITMNGFGQGYGSMSSPTKEFEKEVLTGTMNHEGNPVLAWHISNVVIQQDPAGNQKINKDKATEKVDGAVACVMALGEYLTAQAGDKKPDPNELYKNRGIRTL